MKEKINILEAEKRLLNTLNDSFEDRLYEFAQELFQRGVAKVEENATVVGLNDEEYSDGSDGECTWYDALWQGFFDEVYYKTFNFLKPEYEDS